MKSTGLLQLGDRVFLRSGGVGTIADFAARDAQGRPAPRQAGAPAFYVVQTDDQVACVPFESAGEALRSLVTTEVATEMLDVLRASTAPESPPEPLMERGKRIAHSGTAMEHARFLRELYALPVPVSESLGSGLVFFSKLVLGEIAEVLRLDALKLESEMRKQHPAAQDAWERQRLQLKFQNKP